MAVVVSKGQVFRVTLAISDVRLQQMAEAPSLAAEAMQAGADYWHSKILPRHFDKDARGRYGYAPRSRYYSRNKAKGQKPDLVFSGSLRRDLRARAAYVIGKGSVELKMTARVLNFVPNMPQNSADLYVKQRNGKGYPNMKREIKEITDEERAVIAAVVKAKLTELFGSERAEPQF